MIFSFFPADRHGAVLAPLNIDARAHPVDARVVYRRFAAFQNSPVKIGPDLLN